MEPRPSCTWGPAIASQVQSSVAIADDIKGNSSELAAVLRKLHHFILPFFEHCKELNTHLGHAIGVIDAFELIGDIKYWVCQEYKQSTNSGIAARVLSTGVNAGSLALWMNEVKIIKLGSIAQKMGEVRVFGVVGKLVPACEKAGLPALGRVAETIGECRMFSFLTKISLSSVVSAGLGVMYVFFAFEAVDKFIDATNMQQRVSAGIGFSVAALEVTLAVLTAAAVANAIALAVIGGAALALIVTKLVWDKVYKHELQSTQQVRNLIQQPVLAG